MNTDKIIAESIAKEYAPRGAWPCPPNNRSWERSPLAGDGEFQ